MKKSFDLAALNKVFSAEDPSIELSKYLDQYTCLEEFEDYVLNEVKSQTEAYEMLICVAYEYYATK